jgi:hypothetical protein
MTKIANPGFTKKFDSCADMLAVAGPKVNFSTLAIGESFISRDYFPRTGAVYFKMQKTGVASAEVTVVFDRLKALPYSAGVAIPGDMVVTACSPEFGNPTV